LKKKGQIKLKKLTYALALLFLSHLEICSNNNNNNKVGLLTHFVNRISYRPKRLPGTAQLPQSLWEELKKALD